MTFNFKFFFLQILIPIYRPNKSRMVIDIRHPTGSQWLKNEINPAGINRIQRKVWLTKTAAGMCFRYQ